MKLGFFSFAAVCVLVTAANVGWSAPKLDLSECKKAEIKFDDGDSFSCGEEQVRVLGIDAPEVAHPRHGFHKDQPYGQNASQLTKKLLSEARRIVMVRGGKDPYGRTLAHIIIDGDLLGVRLLKAGLAYENVSRYGTNGLPEFALMIKEAAKISPKPKFDDPHVWRKQNKGKK